MTDTARNAASERACISVVYCYCVFDTVRLYVPKMADIGRVIMYHEETVAMWTTRATSAHSPQPNAGCNYPVQS